MPGKPQRKVSRTWSPQLAYAVGLITTDGNLSSSGRHIGFTSKDEELALLYKEALALKNKLGKKARGGSSVKKYFVVQFGDIAFYEFLLNLGLTPRKSRTLKSLEIPHRYFAAFLRGCIDGDGSIGISFHPESKYPQLRIRIYSASFDFISWLKQEIARLTTIKKGWVRKQNDGMNILSYGTEDSLTLSNFIYYNDLLPFLKRKKERIEEYHALVAELAYAHGLEPCPARVRGSNPLEGTA